MPASPSPFTVAIIGGGLVGLHLAAGLQSRNLHATVYEQSRAPRRPLGAGLGFSSWTLEVIRLLDPRVASLLIDGIGAPMGDNMRFVNSGDGGGSDRRKEGEGEGEGRYYDFELSLRQEGLGCLRAQLLEGLDGIVGEGVVVFGRRVESVEEGEGGRGKVVMRFEDGTEEEADCVIACDGIKSTVRRHLLGDAHPAAHPTYTHQSVHRCIIPMLDAIALLGDPPERATSFLYELGPGAQMVHYPIARGSLMNVVAYVTDRDGEEGWSGGAGELTARATRGEVVRAFEGWVGDGDGGGAAALAGRFAEEGERWGLFDMAEHPLGTYAFGRVCLAGDAAHASTPHMGLGVAMGIEDALVLCTVLDRVASILQKSDGTYDATDVGEMLAKAFRVYDSVRRERSQWVVESSRVVGDTLNWSNPEVGNDVEKMAREVDWRFEKGFVVDGREMVERSLRELDVLLGS